MSPEVVALAWWVLETFSALALVYYVILNGAYMITSWMAFPALLRHTGRLRALDFEEILATSGAPPITVVAAAFNEEANIREAARSFMGLRYHDFEVIIVDDGSTDGTHRVIHEDWDLVERIRHPVAAIACGRVRRCFQSRKDPRLWVVEKDNAGCRADAVNAGLNFARHPIVCCVDADGILEEDCLIQGVLPFLECEDTVASGGILRVANGCRIENGRVVEVGLPDSWLARYQVIEYLRSFLGGRLGWELGKATFFVSGGWGMFRRGSVLRVGGLPKDSLAEDMELSMRLHTFHAEHGMPYRITFVPEVVCWTEVPETLATLVKQRDRWQRGIMMALPPFRRVLFNSKYGRLGLFSFPFYYLFEMTSPVIELCGLLVLAALLAAGRVSGPHLLAYLSLTVLWGACISLAGAALSELNRRRYSGPRDMLMLIFLSLTEQFVYKPVRVLAQWKGVFSYLRGERSWGQMQRSGFQHPVGASPVAPAGLRPGTGPVPRAGAS